MCAILDNSVVNEVFGKSCSEAGKEFFTWVNSGRGHLIIGGKLLKELDRTGDFKTWRKEAVLAGRASTCNEGQVNAETTRLKRNNLCQSNDEHVVALARISGARLLYANDKKLEKDFNDKKLIGNPRGKIYSTHGNKKFSAGHKRLLQTKNLCRRSG